MRSVFLDPQQNMATLPSSDHKQEEEKEEEQQVNQEIEQEVKQEVKQEEQGEEVARLNVLLVQNETKQLSGWNTIFHQDEDDDEDEGENNQEEHEVHLPPLYKSKLTIHVKREEEEEEEEEEDAKKKKLYYHKDYSLVLWQAETGFGSTGEDTTGHVLWGASCCLAHYLLQQQQQEPHSIQHLIQNKTVMELGCGSCAVPSLVVSLYLNAKSVIATDVSQSSLDCVQRQVVENTSTHILLNDDDHDKNNNNKKKTMMNLTIASLDWEQQDDDDNSNKNNNHHHECVDQKENNNKVDILLAADVIYGVAMVPALVSTIQRYMHSQSILLIATRDGRRGISEFQMLIQQQQHKQQFHLKCIHQVTYDQVPCTMSRRRMEDHHEDHHEDPHYYDCPDIATERRWQGGRHTIYQYIVPHKTNNNKKK